MAEKRIIICDKNLLVREGLKAIVAKFPKFSVIAESSNFEDLQAQLIVLKPDLLILDPSSISDAEFMRIRTNFSSTHVLCISDIVDTTNVRSSISRGVDGYIFKDCDKHEVEEAIEATSVGEKFFCGKAIEVLEDRNVPENCQPLKVSSREAEIIRLIAEGLTNKEIADRLCLSSHTITTHRKNIMTKLGLTNTAGLVLYAIRENLVKAN